MSIGFGIIGCGDIATRSFAPALRASEYADLVAVCRRDIAAAEEFAHRFECPRAYASAEELAADDQVDAVIVATPTHVHCKHTELAAKHGKHVLCEKPMAMNGRECIDMIDACKKAGVKLGVAYRRRLFPQVVRAIELISQGAIGNVVCIRTHYSGWYEGPTETSWRLAPEIGGGGVLMDMAVHRIEVLLNFAFVSGTGNVEGRPKDVSAIVETVHHNWPVDDSCALLLRFPHCIGVHSAIWTSPPRHDFGQIDGTRGRILLDPLESHATQVQLETASGNRIEEVTPLHAPYFDLPMIDDFAHAIIEAREPVCDGATGYWTQAVVDAAYESSRDRRAVPVNPMPFR